MEKHYSKEDLTVIWKSDLCIHSGNCVRGLKAVFDPDRRPWIDMSAADKERIVEQVKKCPSGALSYKWAEDPTEIDQIEEMVEVTAIPNGPLQVNASCEVTLPDGEIVTKKNKTFFCRCGSSSNKPFCDGSHKKVGFQG